MSRESRLLPQPGNLDPCRAGTKSELYPRSIAAECEGPAAAPDHSRKQRAAASAGPLLCSEEIKPSRRFVFIHQRLQTNVLAGRQCTGKTPIDWAQATIQGRRPAENRAAQIKNLP